MTGDLNAFKRCWVALSIDDKIDMLYRAKAKANGMKLPPTLIPISRRCGLRTSNQY